MLWFDVCTQHVVLMENLIHQTAFLNAPQSERIFPTTVGNFAIQIPILCSVVLFVDMM